MSTTVVDISHRREFTLDIFDVKGSMRPFKKNSKGDELITPQCGVISSGLIE